MNSNRLVTIVVLVGLIVLGVCGRLLPHPPNFTPLAAVALFAGFFFRDVRTAMVVPFVVMMISNAYIGAYDLRIMLVVYAALLFPIALRSVLRSRLTIVRIGITAGAASLLFFLMTNWAVWAFSGMYARTVAGLAQCYTAALPFFKYTLLGDLFWSGALFSLYALVQSRGRQFAFDSAPVPNA